MEWLLGAIVSGAISFLSVLIGMKIGGKTMLDEVENRVINYVQTQEFAQNVASIGTLLAAGFLKQIKTAQPKGGSVNLFGFKIPQTVLDAVIGGFLGNKQQKQQDNYPPP